MKALPKASFADKGNVVENELNGKTFSFQDTLEDVEKKTIINVLNDVNWNRTKAASTLGISRRTLFRKIKRLGLNGPIGPI